MMLENNDKIYIAGHNGLVGSAILRCLLKHNYSNIVFRSSQQLDLTDSQATHYFFEQEKPEYVFLAAAKVGGIHANSNYPAEFIRVNLQIQTNVIDAAYRNSVKKLLFLSSSCCYPKNCPQPIKEEYFLSNYLEPTNEAYAIAKLAGMLMCKSYNKQYGTNFIAAVPTNLYGPNDNFCDDNSHVLPALIRKFHIAKIIDASKITLWGSGKPRREFLHVDDLAEALVLCMKNYNASQNNIEDYFMNIGSGYDLSLLELANMLKDIVGYKGKIDWNTERPDGTFRKVLNIDKVMKLNWQPKISLNDGLISTYNWYVNTKQ